MCEICNILLSTNDEMLMAQNEYLDVKSIHKNQKGRENENKNQRGNK